MKSVLVIGMGRFGRHLASKMLELGNDVMVVDKNAEIVERFSGRFTDSYIGDCTNEQVVKALVANNFDLYFVSIGEDFQSSLVITSLLKQFGAKKVIAKANQDIQHDLLIKIGADEVIYPEREVAETLAIRYNQQNIFDYIKLSGEYSICEIPVVRDWIGKAIITIDVRNKHHVNIIAIKQDDVLQPIPGANYVFRENDHIVLIGRNEDIFKLTSK
ncbi:MAG: TrkA family potassium uptake protein [Ruminococcaceae bacterium]|nr:TrkA family potassium uptake protein [Oscillospiraceae bacterium]